MPDTAAGLLKAAAVWQVHPAHWHNHTMLMSATPASTLLGILFVRWWPCIALLLAFAALHLL
jgi:hypothetical protein